MKKILRKNMLKKIGLILLIIFFALLFLFWVRRGENNEKLGNKILEFTIKHNNLDRKYLVYIPSSYDKEKKSPLVIALHGGGGNAIGATTYFELNDKAEKEGFIAAYPEGFGKKVFGKHLGAWNAGRCCGSALKNNIDDVGFIETMIDKLGVDFNVDKNRVYAAGISNGAQMAYRLGCELSDKIAAIAASGSQGTFDNCNPKKPVPILHIQGKEDLCSPYDGGVCGKCMADFWKNIGIPSEDDSWECAPIESYIDEWRIRNGCVDKKDIFFQNKGATCLSYNGCLQNADVILCAVEGLGHAWAGRDTYSPDFCKKDFNGKICEEWKKTIGPLSQDLIANDIVWDFFKNHSLEN